MDAYDDTSEPAFLSICISKQHSLFDVEVLTCIVSVTSIKSHKEMTVFAAAQFLFTTLEACFDVAEAARGLRSLGLARRSWPPLPSAPRIVCSFRRLRTRKGVLP